MIKLLAFLCCLVAVCQAQSYGSYAPPPPVVQVTPAPYVAPTPAPVVLTIVTPAPYAPAPYMAPETTTEAPVVVEVTPAPYAPALYVAPVTTTEAPVVEVTPAPYAPAPAPVVEATTAAYSAPPAAPVILEQVPAYGTSNLASTFLWSTEAPEFRTMCESRLKMSGDSEDIDGKFYMQHPSKPNMFIQCDEFGRSFLKVCPAETIFTDNIACEKRDHLLGHMHRAKFLGAGMRTAAYGGLQSSEIVEDMGVRAPEFQHLCKRVGLAGLTLFYKPHPVNQRQFIQCDDFGMSFLKTCPIGTIFTENMVCEKIGELHAIMRQSAPIVAPAVPYGSTTLMQSAPIFTPTETEMMMPESPEFKHMCVSATNKMESSSLNFYVAHPTDKTKYIQCDEVGRAFLKMCPTQTIFTDNLTCEKVGELHEIWNMKKQPVLSAVAPPIVEPAPVVVPVVPAPVAEWSQESMKFRSTCRAHRGVGMKQMFYLAHPERNDWFIQCDETGRAFVKTCMSGTIFTENLACEKMGEIIPARIAPEEVPAPIVVEQQEEMPSVKQSASIVSLGGERVSYGGLNAMRVSKIKAIDSMNSMSSQF
jgi:hypothetical protein